MCVYSVYMLHWIYFTSTRKPFKGGFRLFHLSLLYESLENYCVLIPLSLKKPTHAFISTTDLCYRKLLVFIFFLFPCWIWASVSSHIKLDYFPNMCENRCILDAHRNNFRKMCFTIVAVAMAVVTNFLIIYHIFQNKTKRRKTGRFSPVTEISQRNFPSLGYIPQSTSAWIHSSHLLSRVN